MMFKVFENAVNLDSVFVSFDDDMPFKHKLARKIRFKREKINVDL